MIEPLPTELEHLVAAETTAPVTSAHAQAVVRARLVRTLGITAAATATVATAKVASANAATTATAATAGGAAAVKSAVALKLAGAVLAVGTVGTVATVAVTREPEPRTPAPIVERAPRQVPAPQPSLRVEPIVEPVVEPVVEPIVEPLAEPSVQPPAVSAPAKRTKQVTPPPTQPAAAPPPSRTQPQLLADASRSLSLGDAAHALELIDEDTRIRSEGPLVEEREALRISALLALGRAADARDAARRLLATYPHSIHRRLAERVLAKETP